METLREISENYQEILWDAVNCDELSSEMIEKITSTNEKFDKKIENMAYVAEEITAKCNVAKNEVDRLNRRIDRWQKNLDSLKEYIKNEMISVGKNKVESPFYTVRIKRSQVCEVGEDFINEAKEKKLTELLRIIPEQIKPNKAAIKDYINSGKALRHAKIVEKQSLNIK